MQIPEGERNVSSPDEPPMSCAFYMRRVQEAVRPHLPESLQHYRYRSHNRLVQVYYDDPALHYEIWTLHSGQPGRAQRWVRYGSSADGGLN